MDTDRAGAPVRLSHVDGTGLEDGAGTWYGIRRVLEYYGGRMTVGHWALSCQVPSPSKWFPQAGWLAQAHGAPERLID